MRQVPPYDPADKRFLTYLNAWREVFAARAFALEDELEDLRAESILKEDQLDYNHDQVIAHSEPTEAAWTEYWNYYGMPNGVGISDLEEKALDAAQ